MLGVVGSLSLAFDWTGDFRLLGPSSVARRSFAVRPVARPVQLSQPSPAQLTILRSKILQIFYLNFLTACMAIYLKTWQGTNTCLEAHLRYTPPVSWGGRHWIEEFPRFFLIGREILRTSNVRQCDINITSRLHSSMLGKRCIEVGAKGVVDAYQELQSTSMTCSFSSLE